VTGTTMDKMMEIERLARIICAATTGHDPDVLFITHEPQKLANLSGFVPPPPGYARPLWENFIPTAIAVLEAGYRLPIELADEPATPEDEHRVEVEEEEVRVASDPSDESLRVWRESAGLE
jgi:hypothetical protein